MVILQGREKGIKRAERSLNIFDVFLIVKFYTTMYLNDYIYTWFILIFFI